MLLLMSLVVLSSVNLRDEVKSIQKYVSLRNLTTRYKLLGCVVSGDFMR